MPPRLTSIEASTYGAGRTFFICNMLSIHEIENVEDELEKIMMERD